MGVGAARGGRGLAASDEGREEEASPARGLPLSARVPWRGVFGMGTGIHGRLDGARGLGFAAFDTDLPLCDLELLGLDGHDFIN